MSHRVEAAYAGPDYTPLPAHPAPDANAWGDLQSNVHSFKLTAGEVAHAFQPHPDATLFQIYVSGPCLMLVDGGMVLASPEYAADNNVPNCAFPLAAAGYYSYSVDPGKTVFFQAMPDGSDVYVTVLEG